MKVSKWRKSNEVIEMQEAWLSTVNVETAEDGRPHTCIISIARYDEEGNLVTKIIEFNVDEMFNMTMGEWQHAQHAYTNKLMAENRYQAGLSLMDLDSKE